GLFPSVLHSPPNGPGTGHARDPTAARRAGRGAGDEARTGLRHGTDSGLRPPRPPQALPARRRRPRPGQPALALARLLLRRGPRPRRLRAPAPDARRLAQGVPPHPQARWGAPPPRADLRQPLAPHRPHARPRLPPAQLRLLHPGPGTLQEVRALLLRLLLPP